jgi:hypothetical protein
VNHRRSALALLTLSLAGSADTLRLRSGATVNGNFLGGSADEIRFMVNDAVERFPRADVAFVTFGGDDAPSGIAPVAAPKIDPGPDIANVPFLRGSDGYITLEREIGMMDRQRGGYGGYGGGTVYRIPGQSSQVRVRQSDKIVFVIRASGVDPRQFQLYRLESRMGYRQTQPTMGGAPMGLPMRVNKIGDNVYELTPSRLSWGEYAVSAMNSSQSYCFGVD